MITKPSSPSPQPTPRLLLPTQILSQGGSNAKIEGVSLDVHSLAELSNRSIKTTDDAPKYSYQLEGDKDYYGTCGGVGVSIGVGASNVM